MGEEDPKIVVDQDMYDALDRFAAEFPISFEDEPLRCPFCAREEGAFCTREGFGQGRYRTLYLHGRGEDDLRWDRLNQQDPDERRHQYEYSFT